MRKGIGEKGGSVWFTVVLLHLLHSTREISTSLLSIPVLVRNVTLLLLLLLLFYPPEYFQGLWGDRNTANFDERILPGLVMGLVQNWVYRLLLWAAGLCCF